MAAVNPCSRNGGGAYGFDNAYFVTHLPIILVNFFLNLF
jgi:hypothetical protein